MAIKSFIKKPFSIPMAMNYVPDSVQKETLFQGFKVKSGWDKATKQMTEKVVIKKGNRLDIILD
jgi:hypothetical protein